MGAERTLRALEGLPRGFGAVHLLCRAETTGVERLPPLVVITGIQSPWGRIATPHLGPPAIFPSKLQKKKPVTPG